MWHKDKSKKKLKKEPLPVAKPKATKSEESVVTELKRDEKVPLQPKTSRKSKSVTFDLHVAVTKLGTVVLR